MSLGIDFVRRMLLPMGVAISRPGTIERLSREQRELMRMKLFHSFLSSLTHDAMASAVRMFPESKGENFQDIFAMLVLGEHKNGFFVEFGATDGVAGSNSYMFEKTFYWSGILAEPARCWHAALQHNRATTISHKCVWRETGARLAFREVRDSGFSTLEAFTKRDRHVQRKGAAKTYEVETITLNDLLSEHDAPKVIDYMSIYTEGSEFDILEAFNFERHRPLVLTVEHNFRLDREKMLVLMGAQGYVRAPTQVSNYDDWFVCKTHAEKLAATFSKSAFDNA